VRWEVYLALRHDLSPRTAHLQSRHESYDFSPMVGAYR
jgi:hypothetical protein